MKGCDACGYGNAIVEELEQLVMDMKMWGEAELQTAKGLESTLPNTRPNIKAITMLSQEEMCKNEKSCKNDRNCGQSCIRFVIIYVFVSWSLKISWR